MGEDNRKGISFFEVIEAGFLRKHASVELYIFDTQEGTRFGLET